ncbi:MAG: hypothetical protein KME25_06540 [Symplocastrum torsivum CPER-KK1]|jgi:hypothetical protein|uniref:Uncharacterized protein n=1 Tax=Symplocastrum torsivum CPER-KK1 TaxID=450513 RepID=A0A951PHU5_9CYAN|nr:hypothetical protein [Symplocastrum torsivum CPER-KK1]
MITAKHAIKCAMDYLKSMKEDMGSGSISDIRLEEVELSEDEKDWLITLGYDVPVKDRILTDLGITNPAIGQRYQREYKIFKVESKGGNVKSMKIRKI